MHSRFLKPIVLTSLGILFALPVGADIRADVAGLHIRIATEAPPRARYERQTARPDRDSVWIKGSWDRQNDRWVWVDGRWERPRDRQSHWVSAKYQRDHKAWRYEPAHWSQDQLVEGDDYRQWRDGHQAGSDRHRN